MTLDELLQPDTLDALLLQAYGAQLFAEHRPVLVSQWSKFYFMCFWPTVLRNCPMRSGAWESVRLSVGPGGLPDVIELRGDSTGNAVHELVELNLRQLAKGFSAHGQVPVAVFWSNAGDALEQALRSHTPCHWAQGLLSARSLASGLRNPLHATVRYLPDGQRQVRACCLAWQVPGIGHCEHCPLHS